MTGPVKQGGAGADTERRSGSPLVEVQDLSVILMPAGPDSGVVNACRCMRWKMWF
jgi:hypothetical protein